MAPWALIPYNISMLIYECENIYYSCKLRYEQRFFNISEDLVFVHGRKNSYLK
jgi:hypothetical protein